MSTALETGPATQAIAALLMLLDEAGISATRDAGAFYPQPVGVLVGLPSLVGRTLDGRVYEVSVRVVSGDPLNSTLAVDRLYALADACAVALATDRYFVSEWRASGNADPLTALELTVTATASEGGI